MREIGVETRDSSFHEKKHHFKGFGWCPRRDRDVSGLIGNMQQTKRQLIWSLSNRIHVDNEIYYYYMHENWAVVVRLDSYMTFCALRFEPSCMKQQSLYFIIRIGEWLFHPILIADEKSKVKWVRIPCDVEQSRKIVAPFRRKFILSFQKNWTNAKKKISQWVTTQHTSSRDPWSSLSFRMSL